ncbi:hypothetical protein THASP1DRAFT_24703 [Thamnocephalis sphaerospora]|uniref:Uncharacterized protein n=1 Tax=Thamnocephalis sphaerospora TaxID=78915 RepID=A0A4P9XMF7_9FUNG|nr:hypothetical protein THASP1DRAFT_24703 [Thamnocephalis sphaerospora]|eukprot:RKP07088.1 hypothetical protein THASP1DRAFT_24703 [Thamnocephalis sphaerospora]
MAHASTAGFMLAGSLTRTAHATPILNDSFNPELGDYVQKRLNDNGYFNYYPNFQLVHPPLTQRVNRYNDTNNRLVRMTFERENGDFIRVVAIKYVDGSNDIENLRFINYSRGGDSTCRVYFERNLNGEIKGIRAELAGDRVETIKIRRNWWGYIKDITLQRSWDHTETKVMFERSSENKVTKALLQEMSEVIPSSLY